MHKAWSNIEDGTKKSPILTQMERFRTVTSPLNSQMAMKWCTKLEVAWKRCPIVFQGHLSNFKVTRKKIADFDLNLVFPACNFILISQMAMKWYTKLRRGALLFFKVIRQISRSHGTKKLPILSQIWRFRTVAPFWFDRWLWNEAQSLK